MIVYSIKDVPDEQKCAPRCCLCRVRPATRYRRLSARPKRKCSKRTDHTALQSYPGAVLCALYMRTLYGVFAVREGQTGRGIGNAGPKLARSASSLGASWVSLAPSPRTPGLYPACTTCVTTSSIHISAHKNRTSASTTLAAICKCLPDRMAICLTAERSQHEGENDGA